MMLKRMVFTLTLFAGFPGASVGGEPVIGLWEKIPVLKSGQVLARPSFVFTNEKLKEAVVFTGLQDSGGELLVVCCVSVTDLKPVDLGKVLRKYAADTEFVDHLNSIKGLPFVYKADAISKSEWNSQMVVIMSHENDSTDGVPYSVPVISQKLGKAASIKPSFNKDGKSIRLSTVYSKDGARVSYEFNIDGLKTKFSEAAFPVD